MFTFTTFSIDTFTSFLESKNNVVPKIMKFTMIFVTPIPLTPRLAEHDNIKQIIRIHI